MKTPASGPSGLKPTTRNWAKVPSDLNQTEWLLTRTALLNEKKNRWEARRQPVYVEGQNNFLLRGQTAILAGQPDLIVERSTDALIIDFQAGHKQPSHYLQIMIYMYALPKALPQYQHAKLAGEVVYPTRTARYQWAVCTPSSKKTSAP